MMEIFRKEYLPFWILAIFMAVACCMTEWMGDAIDYSFIIRGNGADPVAAGHIRGIGDIIVSQSNHYLSENGRFFVHFLVQLFCGLLGKYAFAVCNAVVWWLLPYLSLKVTGLKVSLKNSVIAGALAVILMYYLRLDPPFQINYVWMSVMTLGFLDMFLKDRSAGKVGLVFTALYSLLLGGGNEAFTLVIGIGIIDYAIVRNFKLSQRQWVMAVSCAVGAVILIASPGNWARFGLAADQFDGLVRLEMMLPALIIPLLTWVVVKTACKRIIVTKEDLATEVFLWAGAVAGFVMCIVLKGSSGARMAIPANLFLAILILRRIDYLRIGQGAVVAVALLIAALLGFVFCEDLERSRVERNMYALYDASADGTVYLTDKEFSEIARCYVNNRRTYALMAEYLSPGKPALRVRPESMRRVPEAADTNLISKLSDNTWLLYRSKTSPADFVIRKTILPGIVNKEMSERVLRFYKGGDVVIDSTDNCLVGVYVNERPYIKAWPELRETDYPQ